MTNLGNFATVAVVALSLAAMTLPIAASEPAEVSGALTANGKQVALPYVYIWPEKEGFYDAADPTWKIVFVEREVGSRDLGEPIWDAAWVEIGVTETSEFGDKPELQVYTQSIRFSAESGGNLSGGNYPQIEIEGFGTDRISGRVYHTDAQEHFDDTYSYDFTFSASLSDPDAPVGDALPDGGGEPGLAYMKWSEAVHSDDLEALKSIVPPELAEQIDGASAEELREQIEFMRLTTPTEVQILQGSMDGEIAVLQIEGTMDGEKVAAEVEMTKMGEFWIPTKTSM